MAKKFAIAISIDLKSAAINTYHNVRKMLWHFSNMRENGVIRIIHFIVGWSVCLFFNAFAIIQMAIIWWKNKNAFAKPKILPKPDALENWIHGKAKLSYNLNQTSSQEVTIHYVEQGDLMSPLLLMVHGFPDFWYSWRFQIKHFAKSYHVVAVDMRGYNESEAPVGIEHYQAHLVAKDIVELIQYLGYNGGVLVAHDWGGAIAWHIAAAHPEVVKRLIILNGPHPLAFQQHLRTSLSQFIKYIYFFQMPIIPETFISLDNFARLIQTIRGSKGLINKENFTDEDEKALLYTFSSKDKLTGPINYYRASFQMPTNFSIFKNLIKAKTLILWGINDHFLEKKIAEYSSSYCEMSQLRFVENASHWPHIDQPEQVNMFIENFLQQI
ncbi:unnamed protein product [Dracunculus medinensis]|uniref:AB hydrolase-1 domain-containing protein n=1 Tax=Dracunculus medinensis TaxID=318479 RepID=A0A0N4UHG3_DRAME|nr:unnamed protein product [Dracunculus medinensis]